MDSAFHLGQVVKPWGRVGAVGFVSGERYYWFLKGNVVSMMPADVVEKGKTEMAPKVIKTGRQEQLVLHYMLLTRQLTKMSDALLHVIRGEDELGYRAFAQTELSDAIRQCEKLSSVLGVDFQETLQMGRDRDAEKEAEWRKMHPGGLWI